MGYISLVINILKFQAIIIYSNWLSCFKLWVNFGTTALSCPSRTIILLICNTKSFSIKSCLFFPGNWYEEYDFNRYKKVSALRMKNWSSLPKGKWLHVQIKIWMSWLMSLEKYHWILVCIRYRGKKLISIEFDLIKSRMVEYKCKQYTCTSICTCMQVDLILVSILLWKKCFW